MGVEGHDHSAERNRRDGPNAKIKGELEQAFAEGYDSAIVFTQYADTMNYLKDYLGDQLPGNGSRNAFLARLVQQFHFGPQQIHRVVRSAIEAAALRNPESPTLDEADLWQFASFAVEP